MKRSTLIAVAVFAALLAVGIVTSTRDPERGISRIDLSGVDTSAVDRIEISGKNKATLVKGSDTWTLDGKLADKAAVEKILADIPKINSSDLVTRSKEKYTELELDEANATIVKLLAGGKVVAELQVGKASTGGAHVKVGDEVYKVNGVYPRTFAKDGTAWLERKLFQVEQANIQRVEVALAGQAPYAIVRGEGGNFDLEDKSVLPEGFRFDGKAVGRLTSTVAGLRAKDILSEDPGAEATGFGSAEINTIRFTTKAEEGGTAQNGEVVFGKLTEDDTAQYAKVTGRDDIMTVYKSTVTGLLKQPIDFREMTLVQLDKAKVNAIEIKDGSRKLTLTKKGTNWSVGTSTDAIPSDFTLDPTAVERRISALANVQGMAVADVSPAAAGVTNPAARVVATLEGGETVTLAFGTATKHQEREATYVTGNIDRAVYVVNDYSRKNLLGMLDSFEKKAGGPEGSGGPGGPGGLANLDPSALKNLPPDVRKSLEQQIQQQRQQQQMIEAMQKQAESAQK